MRAHHRSLLALALACSRSIAPLLAPNDYVVGVTRPHLPLRDCWRSGLNIVVGFAGLARHRLRRLLRHRLLHLCLPRLAAFRPPPAVSRWSCRSWSSATAVSGVLIGAPTLRLRGDYLAIVTLGFGEITYILLLNLDRPINITGGPSGDHRIDPPRSSAYAASAIAQYYYLFLALLGLVLVASARLRDSRIGWAWQAIREDELAAEAMGINTTVAKLQAFAIGASFAGLRRRPARVVAALGVSRTTSCSRSRSTSWRW